MKKKTVSLLFILLTLSNQCKKLPYTPDENAIIYLQALPSAIKPGETAKINLSGEKSSGYPLPNDTIVFLSTSVGSLPNQVSLIDGKAEALYQSDPHFTGDVMITARSGKALVSPEQLVITVTTSDVAYLYISANPPVLPPEGGDSTIIARALDENMEPASGKILWLETTAGSLNQNGESITDSQGTVTALLSTNQPASVTVKYKDLEQAVNITLEEANIPPIAEFVYSPQTPGSGESIYFNAGASRDEDGNIVSFQWDFGDGSKTNGQQVSHTYHTEIQQVFVVTLRVTDNEGAESVTSQDITVHGPVENQDPEAAFVYSPKTPQSGESIYFNAEPSSDSDGTIVSYQWNFGDGLTGQGKMVDHTYYVESETTVSVTLRVFDDRGGEDVAAQEIIIDAAEANNKPEAAFDYSPKSPKSGDIIYFNGGASFDSDGQIVSYKWDFGDGHTAAGETVSHTYDFEMETKVTVSLIVLDNQGAEDVESKEITIGLEDNRDPVAVFDYSPKSPRSGEQVYFNASASYDADGTIVSYRWDFGDGSTARGETVSHTFTVTVETTYVIILKVIDDKGAEDVASTEITIKNE